MFKTSRADFTIKGGGMIPIEVYSATALHKDKICTGCQHHNNLYFSFVTPLKNAKGDHVGKFW